MDFLKRFLGQATWKKEWQDQLTEVLRESQRGLNVHMVVAIAVESDFYAEVLFMLSFLGLGLGTFLALIFKSYLSNPHDLILFPVGGFALGASLFQFKYFYLHRFAPRAIRERVALKAKALFYDHSQNLKGRLAVLYFSELESEILFVTSPDLLRDVPEAELQLILSDLIRKYKRKRPLEALKPALLKLGELLRVYLGSPASPLDLPEEMRRPIYIGPSDRPAAPMKVPILKGSKDIN